MDEPVSTNINVVYEASRILEEGTSSRGVDNNNIIEGGCSQIVEEDGKMPDIIYALLPLEDTVFDAKGLKKKNIT